MGRPISKENVAALRAKRKLLIKQKNRVIDQITEVEKELGHYSGNMCWSCKMRDCSTTALSMCELENPLYPDSCSEFERRQS